MSHPSAPALTLCCLLLLGHAGHAAQSGSLPLPKTSAPPYIGMSTSTPTHYVHGRTAYEEHFRGLFHNDVEDPGLESGRESLRLSIFDILRSENPVSIEGSDLIVIATVKSAEALLASHRRAVYTDYDLSVETVVFVKQDFVPMDDHTLVGAQLGGSIRFPSGHIKHFIVQDQSFLAISGRYLLFLWADDLPGTHYQITNGYRIVNNQTFAIEDAKPFLALNGYSLSGMLQKIAAQTSR